jgi:DNA polymerase-3 subunit epsilon
MAETSPTGFVYFDLETTGLDVTNDRIVSVAASCCENKFYSLVNPTIPIPRGASNVHKIYDEHVVVAPTWADVAPRLFEFVAKHGGPRPALVAYNGNRFDFPLLVAETKRAAVGSDVKRHVESLYGCDAYVLARERLPKMPSKSLANVYKHLFGETMAGQHTADGDVAALKRICSHPSVSQHIPKYVHAFALDKFVASEPNEKQ